MKTMTYVYNVKDADSERHYEMVVDLTTGQILEERGDRSAYFAAKQLEKQFVDFESQFNRQWEQLQKQFYGFEEQFNRQWESLLAPFDNIFGSFSTYSMRNRKSNFVSNNKHMYENNKKSLFDFPTYPDFSEPEVPFYKPAVSFSEPELSFIPNRHVKGDVKTRHDKNRGIIDSESPFGYDRPEFRERVWEFNGKRFKLIDELDTRRIVEAKGNPDIVELAKKFGKYDDAGG